VPFSPAADRDVQPAAVPGVVACRCCPGGNSRSTRARRYPPDMTGAEWGVCEPLLPAPAWLAGCGGHPASWCMRDVVDAIRYLTHNGPVWRALPADFRPRAPCTGGRASGRRTDQRSRCTMTCATASGGPRGARRLRRQARHLGRDQAQAETDAGNRETTR
jgi:transposase